MHSLEDFPIQRRSYKEDWSHLQSSNSHSDPLNDWSPTIVDNNVKFESIEPNNYSRDSHILTESSNHILMNDDPHSFNHLFHNLYSKFYPSVVYDDVFWEQWQYVIVTCNVLNEYNHFKHNVLKLKRSLANLNTNSTIRKLNNIELPLHRIILKKICLLIRHQRLNGRTPEDYNKILLIYKLYYDDKRQRQQLEKQDLLYELNNTINSISILDSLFQRFYLSLKEIKNYKTISSDVHPDINRTIPQMKNFMKCLYDICFFKIKNQLDQLIIHTDPEILSKYCKLYAIDMIDLRYYINQNCMQLIDKSQRLKFLLKFWLCVLLSLRIDFFQLDNDNPDRTHNLEKNEFLSILQFGFTMKETSLNKKISIKEILKQLGQLNQSLIDLMNNHKSYLHLGENFNLFDTGNIKLNTNNSSTRDNNYKIRDDTNKAFTLMQKDEFIPGLLNVLDHLKLQLHNDNAENAIRHKDTIVNKLNEILQLFNQRQEQQQEQEEISSLETYIDSMHCMDTRIISTTSIGSHHHHGFALDILKHNLSNHHKMANPLSFNTQRDPKRSKLNQPIDIVLTSDNFGPEDIESQMTDESDIASTNRDLRKISDQELSQQLNAKIKQFASQNKLIKGKLRAQKSFQLLKKRPHLQWNTQESTEALIPVLYECNELANL